MNRRMSHAECYKYGEKMSVKKLDAFARGHAAKASGAMKENPYFAGKNRREWERGWRFAYADGVGD